MVAISSQTRVCGIIGKPLGHSLSPAIHNASFESLGLNLVYLAFEVDDPIAALAGMRSFDLRGLSVTIPYKTAVIPGLDQIDEVARMIGAVNTIVNQEGKLIGYNTDGSGALRSLKEAGIGTEGKPVLILGSGGAARAIAFSIAMKSRPTRIRILGIIPEELKNLTEDLGEKTGVPVSGDLLTEATLPRELKECRVLIHATPVGMHPRTEETLVPDELLHPDLQVFDVIYNPDQTRLIKSAKSRGLVTASGLPMFLYQAADQFRLFTGEEAPLEVMKQVLLAHFSRPETK